MPANLGPENLEIELSEALNNLNSPMKLGESNLMSLTLIAKYKQKQPSALPYQLLRVVLTDILDLLEKENADYAEILRGRFWEGLSPANMIANGRPKQWSEKTFYNYQKKARQEFKALLWQQEQECILGVSNTHTDFDQLPLAAQEEPQPTGHSASKKLSLGAAASLNTKLKLILPVGIVILSAVLIWLFASRIPLQQGQPAAAVVRNPNVLAQRATALPTETTIPPTQPEAAPTEGIETVCGTGQAAPIPVDSSVQRFFRSQGVSNFTANNTPGVLNDKVRSLLIDRSGLWIGYFATVDNPTSGLGHYDRTTRTLATCNHVPFIDGQNINALAVDQTGKLWVGTEKNGLASFDGQGWQHYSTATGLPSNEIYGLTVDEQNNLWVGTWEGVAKLDGATWTVPYTVRNDTLFNDHVHSILFDSQGNIWVGHIDKGISKYRQADGAWMHITASPGGLGGDKVRSMILHQDRSTQSEAIWVATQDGGVSRYENGSWTNYRVEQGLPSNDVRALAVDKYNRIWAATAQGVVYWEDEEWLLYHRLDTFSLAFGITCPDKSCSIDDDHVWTGTAALGLTQSRLPLLKSETPFDVGDVCFEAISGENTCPRITQDDLSGGLSVTYPGTITPGEKFHIIFNIIPRANYELKEERGDMLVNTDADDRLLFGMWQHFKVEGSVEPGQPFKFVDYDNAFTAPQLPDGVQEQSFTSTWRVWRYNRYVGPSIHLIFTVKKP